jgi:hypothetical protein
VVGIAPILTDPGLWLPLPGNTIAGHLPMEETG